MTPPEQPTVETSEHAVPGGEEIDVTITVPTPAGQVNPDTPVVVASDANPDAVAVPAGVVADTHGPGTLVVTPPSSTGPAQGSATSAGAEPTSSPPADAGEQPATTTAGDVMRSVGENQPAPAVARVDDPDKTLVPANELAPGTAVHDPAQPLPGTGPVTAQELADRFADKGLTSDQWGALLSDLDGAGYVITRKP